MKLSGTQKAGAFAILAAVAISFDGCNSPGTGSNTWSIAGVTGPTVTYNTNELTISAVLQNVTLQGGGTIPIPNLPNSTIEIAPDVTGGMLLQLNLSAADVVSLANANILNPNDLPDGRALPGVSGGMLPSIAVQVPSLDDMTFYLSSSVIGAFIPVSLGLSQVIGTFDFYDSSNVLIGQISVVGTDTAGKDSGFLLLLNLNSVGIQMAQQHKLDL